MGRKGMAVNEVAVATDVNFVKRLKGSTGATRLTKFLRVWFALSHSSRHPLWRICVS